MQRWKPLELAGITSIWFIELDCALIHGSSADVGDHLTPETSPLILLDRLTRLDVITCLQHDVSNSFAWN